MKESIKREMARDSILKSLFVPQTLGMEIYMIKKILPASISRNITALTEEIRIRLGRQSIILYRDKEIVLPDIIDTDVFSDILDKITEGSVYIFSESINNGFITIRGGHRVGLSGSAVVNNGKITAINDISSFNIRVAHEIKGVGKRVFRDIVKEQIENTIIVSPPGCGKTTLLRDLTRLISDNISGVRVSLIDERAEIAASYSGIPQNDVGLRTDVFTGYSKNDGIMQAVRSMSPTVIVVDEIGTKEDFDSVLKANSSGVKVIATVHGNDFKNIPNIFKYGIKLAKNNEFDRVEEILCLN